MTQITDTLRDSKRLRLIATALELMQYERTDSAVIPIPRTEPQRYVVVGTAATVARLLEIDRPELSGNSGELGESAGSRPQAAPEAPASEQQAVLDGYRGSTMVSDVQGPKITMRYATSAQADAAHEALCKMIDTTPAAATASAICTVPPSGWVCTRSAGHDGPCAALPAPVCATCGCAPCGCIARAPAPSREAAPVGPELREITRAIIAQLGWTINGTWVITKSGDQLHTADAIALVHAALARAPLPAQAMNQKGPNDE